MHFTNYIISDTNWLGKIKEKELELDVLHIVRVSKGLPSFMGNCLNLWLETSNLKAHHTINTQHQRRIKWMAIVENAQFRFITIIQGPHMFQAWYLLMFTRKKHYNVSYIWRFILKGLSLSLFFHFYLIHFSFFVKVELWFVFGDILYSIKACSAESSILNLNQYM